MLFPNAFDSLRKIINYYGRKFAKWYLWQQVKYFAYTGIFKTQEKKRLAT